MHMSGDVCPMPNRNSTASCTSHAWMCDVSAASSYPCLHSITVLQINGSLDTSCYMRRCTEECHRVYCGLRNRAALDPHLHDR